MSDDKVRVEFEVPRQCVQHKRSWKLTVKGQPDLYLPLSATELQWKDSAVGAVVVPQWVSAETNWSGAKVSAFEEEQPADVMSRYDWYRLGVAMALIVDGNHLQPRDVVWESRKLAEQLLGE